MLAAVNRLRKVAGLERVPVTSVRWKRWIVKPFGEAADEPAPDETEGIRPPAVGQRSAAS
jgi:hypothetical protein